MINYNYGKNENTNWIVEETIYKEKFLGKTESTFLLGNGYFGIRSANEESTANTTRNTFISGTFNKADENEVTELPNVNDVYSLDLFVDGEQLIINDTTVTNYSKRLNVRTGLLERKMDVTNGDLVVHIATKRFISLANIHLTASVFEVTANKDVSIEFYSMIDGQVSNSGAQHFYEGEKKLIDGKYLENVIKTTQSKVEVATHVAHNFNQDIDSLIMMDRRKVGFRYRANLTSGIPFTMEKYATFTTSIDLDCQDNFVQTGLEILQDAEANGFAAELEKSVAAWNEYWNEVNIEIEGDDFTLLSVRYAQYQLRVNCPMHDERMNIGAKGLSGEGYKGHTFWDTELFMLPYFIFAQPQAARSLVKYRYHGLEGARLKAKENNYQGAMYPWEAAWPSDGEVTPVWGAADVVTGEATKIWSGFIEQHITADVIYGLWLYYQVTGDQEFMNKYGYEMIFDTANFWTSRVEMEAKGYVIKNVIGPDEYKEHVDNNSFTNYMAKWNLDLALSYVEMIDESLKADLKQKIGLNIDGWKDVSNNIFLNTPNEDNVLPQDDTYLTLDTLDLTPYKNADRVGTLFEEYSLSQVNKLQISKQADVMVLFLLMEGLFSKEVKQSSFEYYEPKTLHDSSLSLSTHVVLAQDLGNTDISEVLFERACKIDIGENMKSSDHGIHTASLGGIWQGVVYGFGGVRIVNEQLRIEPSIHSKWNKLAFRINYQSQVLAINISQQAFTVANHGSTNIKFINKGKTYDVAANDQVTINL